MLDVTPAEIQALLAALAEQATAVRPASRSAVGTAVSKDEAKHSKEGLPADGKTTRGRFVIRLEVAEPVNAAPADDP